MLRTCLCMIGEKRSSFSCQRTDGSLRASWMRVEKPWSEKESNLPCSKAAVLQTACRPAASLRMCQSDGRIPSRRLPSRRVKPLWKSRTRTTSRKTKRPPGFPWAASEAQSATGKNRLGVAPLGAGDVCAGDVRAIETRKAELAERTRIHGRSRFMPHARAPSAPWLLGQELHGGVRVRRERGLNGREHGWSLCGNCRSDVCQTKRFNRRSLL